MDFEQAPKLHCVLIDISKISVSEHFMAAGPTLAFGETANKKASHVVDKVLAINNSM